MRAIWKFPLATDINRIEMPKRALPVRVAAQGDLVCLWCDVDTEMPKEFRTFFVYGTGHEIPGDGSPLYKEYIGTATVGSLELHVFESRLFFETEVTLEG